MEIHCQVTDGPLGVLLADGRCDNTGQFLLCAVMPSFWH